MPFTPLSMDVFSALWVMLLAMVCVGMGTVAFICVLANPALILIAPCYFYAVQYMRGAMG